MPFITLEEGLTIKVPLDGSIDWDETLLRDTWIKISEHDHSGGGRGAPIGASGIADDSISGTKICLNNNEFLRGKDTGGTCGVNILKVDVDNKVLLNNSKINQIQVENTLSLDNTATTATNLLTLDTTVSYKIDYRLKDTTNTRDSVGILLLSYDGADWQVSNTSAGNNELNLDATGTNLTYRFDSSNAGSSTFQYITTLFNK